MYNLAQGCVRVQGDPMSVCQLAGAGAGGGRGSTRERAQHGTVVTERERDSWDSRVRHGRVGRVTGKAAGLSAGVCTTDTCLDSIRGSGIHSFLPIKTEKTDPFPFPARVHPRKSVSFISRLQPRRRIGNCFEPPDATINHPPFVLLLLFFSPPLRSSFLPDPRDTFTKSSGETRSRTGFEWVGGGLADAFHAFISSVIHLFLIRDLDRRKNFSPAEKHFRDFFDFCRGNKFMV